jgi:hypothetical protein
MGGQIVAGRIGGAFPSLALSAALGLVVAVPPYVSLALASARASGFGVDYLAFFSAGFSLPAVAVGAFVFVAVAGIDWFWGGVFGLGTWLVILAPLFTGVARPSLGEVAPLLGVVRQNRFLIVLWFSGMGLAMLAGLGGGAAARLPRRIDFPRGCGESRRQTNARVAGLVVAGVAIALWIVATVLAMMSVSAGPGGSPSL